MWSMGCILAELVLGYPIFPGENEKEQVQLFMEVLGVPPKDLIELGTRTHHFFTENGNPVLERDAEGNMRIPNSKSLSKALSCTDPLFLNFLSLCFVWDPEKRMTAQDSLKHEWVL